MLKPPIQGRNRLLLAIANRLLTRETEGDTTVNGEMLNEMVESYGGIVETEDLSPIHLSTVLFMSIKVAVQEGTSEKLLSHHGEFLMTVLDRLPLASLDSRRLSAVIWAMGQLGPGLQSLDLGGDVTGYLDGLVRLCMKRLMNFKAKQIVNTMMGLASMQCPNVDRLMPTLTAACRRQRSQFSSEQLCRLATALAELNVSDGQVLMESLAFTIRQKCQSTTPSELTQFIAACGRLHVRIASSAMTAFVNKIGSHLRILKPCEVARVLSALTRIAYRPRFEFLEMVEIYVANASSTFEPSEIVDCLDALATFSYAPGTLLEVAKAFMMDYKETCTPSEMIHAIWALSLLDALDISFFKLAIGAIRPMWSQSPETVQQLNEEDCRRLNHCLLHLEILQGDAVRHLLPMGLDEACQQSWYDYQELPLTGDTLSQILDSFEYLGYTVKPPERDPMTGWLMHCIDVNGQQVAIEVVHEKSCFVNEQHRLQGLQKWKHKILKACGWELLIIFEDVWMVMDYREQSTYLSEHMASIFH